MDSIQGDLVIGFSLDENCKVVNAIFIISISSSPSSQPEAYVLPSWRQASEFDVGIWKPCSSDLQARAKGRDPHSQDKLAQVFFNNLIDFPPPPPPPSSKPTPPGPPPKPTPPQSSKLTPTSPSSKATPQNPPRRRSNRVGKSTAVNDKLKRTTRVTKRQALKIPEQLKKDMANLKSTMAKLTKTLKTPPLPVVASPTPPPTTENPRTPSPTTREVQRRVITAPLGDYHTQAATQELDEYVRRRSRFLCEAEEDVRSLLASEYYGRRYRQQPVEFMAGDDNLAFRPYPLPVPSFRQPQFPRWPF